MKISKTGYLLRDSSPFCDLRPGDRVTGKRGPGRVLGFTSPRFYAVVAYDDTGAECLEHPEQLEKQDGD